ncbi:MAG: hypothetical protein ACLPZR_32725 [Solirubrobacteraceae bacterium]
MSARLAPTITKARFGVWLALTVFAIRLGPKVGRHPGVVWRALRRP